MKEKKRRDGEEKGRKTGERRGSPSSRVRARRGCNFQELTYLTTVNMGTLHTHIHTHTHTHTFTHTYTHTHNAYPLFILRSRRTFSIKSVSSEPSVRKGLAWSARLAPPPPSAVRSSLLPCIRFNQNATSVGRARSSRSGTSSVAPSYRPFEALRRITSVTTNDLTHIEYSPNCIHHVNP